MARDSVLEAPAAPRDGLLGELLRLSGPVILARLGIMVMGLTDAVVVDATRPPEQVADEIVAACAR